MSVRFSVRPWMEWGVAVPSVAMVVLSLTLLPEAADVGLPMAGLFALIAAAFGWFGWRNWIDAVLSGPNLEVTRGRTRRTFPTSAIRAVRIERARRPLLPTTVSLLVPGERPIPIARYSLFGRRALAQAATVAATLGVPISDPVGEQLHQSRLAPLRWRGAGDEWAYALLFVVPGLLLVGLGVAVQLR